MAFVFLFFPLTAGGQQHSVCSQKEKRRTGVLAAEIMSSKEVENQSKEEVKGPSSFYRGCKKLFFFSILAHKKK